LGIYIDAKKQNIYQRNKGREFVMVTESFE